MPDVNGDKKDISQSREEIFRNLCQARGLTLRILGTILTGLSLVPPGLGAFAIYRVTSEASASYSPLGVGIIVFLTILSMAALLALPIIATAHLLRVYTFDSLIQPQEQNPRGRRVA